MDSDDDGNGGIFLFGKSTAKITKPVDPQASTGLEWPARLKKRPSLPKPTEETLKAVVVTGEEIRKGALRMISKEADYNIVMGRKPKRRHRVSRKLRNLQKAKRDAAKTAAM